MINAKKHIKASKLLFGTLAFFLILALTLQCSSRIFSNNERYITEVCSATEKKTVILDAGHGGEDCGAIGQNGTYEKDLNLQITFTLGEMLTEKGYAVVYTRTDDKLLYTEAENIKGIRKISDLKNRCKIAKEYPESIFVSLHMNSFSDSKYSGLQVYYSKNTDSSRILAQCVQSTVTNNLQKDNKRTIKAGTNMYVLQNIDNTAILIECGFISNTEECKKLSEKEYQKELCFSIMCGMIEYMENKNSI